MNSTTSSTVSCTALSSASASRSTEDMFYFFTRFVGPAQGANEIGALIEGYWIRVISGGLYSHPLYASPVGMGLAYWATRTDEPVSRRRLFLWAAWRSDRPAFLLEHAPRSTGCSATSGAPELAALQLDQGHPAAHLHPRPRPAARRAANRRTSRRHRPGCRAGHRATRRDARLSSLRSRFRPDGRWARARARSPPAARAPQREQLRYAMIATQTIDNRETCWPPRAN